jgi:hypothetical protein
VDKMQQRFSFREYEILTIT